MRVLPQSPPSVPPSQRDLGLRNPPGHDVVPADGESHERYFVDPNHASITTRCFVAAAANVTTASLPTGVVCHPGDMAGVFDGPCLYNRWDGSSDFKFAGADEMHDYSVVCPIQPRPWLLASSLQPSTGRAPSTPLTVACPALNSYHVTNSIYKTPNFSVPDNYPDFKYVSNQAECGLSVAATTGGIRSQ